MRFVISSYACKNNACQRLEVKTDTIFKTAEAIRFFLITSNTCIVKIWKGNKKGLPDIVFMPEFSQYDYFLDDNFPNFLKNKMNATKTL